MTSALYRIVSLLDLMERVNFAIYNGIAFLDNLGIQFQRTPAGAHLPKENHENLLSTLDFLLEELPNLDVPISLSKAKLLDGVVRNEIQVAPSFHGLPHVSFDAMGVGRYSSFANDLRVRFAEEMAQKLLFSIPARNAAYYDPKAPLFGAEVDKAFPSAAPEIDEAGKCRATGRWTACVMHLMRALEPALMAFQAALKVPHPKVNWQAVLNQINAQIKANGPQHVDHQWNSEASLQFLRFKDAWRNYAMHGKERYDEERAIAIYESVRGFMRHLATRLSE